MVAQINRGFLQLWDPQELCIQRPTDCIALFRDIHSTRTTSIYHSEGSTPFRHFPIPSKCLIELFLSEIFPEKVSEMLLKGLEHVLFCLLESVPERLRTCSVIVDSGKSNLSDYSRTLGFYS